MAEPAKQGDKIRCDACPVMCYIAPGRAGACDRYANEDGNLVRVDPLVIIDKTIEAGGEIMRNAVRAAFAGGDLRPFEVGGSAGLREVSNRVLDILKS